MNKSLIPVAMPKRAPLKEGMKILAADVGGTKTDLALFEMKGDQLSMVKESLFPSAEFMSLEDIILSLKKSLNCRRGSASPLQGLFRGAKPKPPTWTGRSTAHN
ncbi:MAG: glucokinase [Saprospiraceae bacterium]|nr:glucokinase [Saprospiraceae bacterium]